MDKFTQAYIEAMLWSSTDDTGNPLDARFSTADISDEAMKRIEHDCQRFQQVNHTLIEGETEQAGHDFWLTRNQHGAGFWDGDWPEANGKALTDWSHACGECDVYEGDDGKLYLM